MSRSKPGIHPLNRNKARHDFDRLIEAVPDLADHITKNVRGENTIDFFDPVAVRLLNTAILKLDYGIEYYDLPPEHLCPPIPGRADYIHHLADLLAGFNRNKIPLSNRVSILDIGTGANCIYPILGNRIHGWTFVGSDIFPNSLEHASQLIDKNSLEGSITLRKQNDPQQILKGIIAQNEFFDAAMCNPPFHSNEEEARSGARRKVRTLKGRPIQNVTLNFGGRANELWRTGGEKQFITDYIIESTHFPTSCFMYTCLLSKQANADFAQELLKKSKATFVRIIPMAQGNKQSRFIAWSFLNAKQQRIWAETRWK